MYYPGGVGALYGMPEMQPVCNMRYEPAWGIEGDSQMKRSQIQMRSGEIPPATPDPNMAFKMHSSIVRPGILPQQLRQDMEKLKEYPMMSSPMFLNMNFHDSPRPPTRTYASMQQRLNHNDISYQNVAQKQQPQQPHNQYVSQNSGNLSLTFNINMQHVQQ